jgi:type IV secretion system protein VirB6
MKNDKFKLMLLLTVIAIITCLILWIMAIIGSMNITKGCFYRYNLDSQGNLSSADNFTDTVTLKGNANYTATDADNESIILDPLAYGHWLNSNLRITSSQLIKFKIKGEVSLCRAYIPINNVQQDSNLDSGGQKIPIPRIEEKTVPPVSLIMDARKNSWGNLTEIYRNDEYYVAIQRDQKTTASVTSQYDYFLKDDITADCREGSRSYSPICGRYTLWQNQEYVSGCSLLVQCYKCNCDCKLQGTGWSYAGDPGEALCNSLGADWKCDWCSCYVNVKSTNPEPYKDDGRFTVPTPINDVNQVLANVNMNCSTGDPNYINGPYQNQRFMWLSADIANGLLSRIDTSVIPTNRTSTGSGYSWAQIASDQSFYNNSSNYRIVAHEEAYSARDVGYLQYRLADFDGSYDDNTGGYVINIRQTKCKRANGVGMNDSFPKRGVVQYVIADYGQNPNTMSNLTVADIDVDSDGSGSINLPGSSKGYLWLRIKNAAEDYQDANGQYDVSFSMDMSHGKFFTDVLEPLFEGLKTRIKDASITVFKNMTCYQGIGGAGHCTNFFNYIKGLLILYIMFYGMMFLLGMVQINQTDLVNRVIKIALVAGLINDQTFEFFSQYVFDFVTNFSDNIIANMSGYNLVSGGSIVSNPFNFMDEVFTKFFLSATFAAQIMALLSMGLNGVLYFIIIFVCIGIVIITGFRAIAVYLMAYLAIAVLIGIAPLFLTFILFERTRYLFENWVKFTSRYMLEPTVMLAGIIILMQLFTIYLDYVIGYSVCWKCAIPFKIPFPSIPGFNPAFLDTPLFCFNWFAPWGYDYRSSSMGVNMTNMVVLLMLAYCMWGWIEFSAKIVARLTGGVGGPSATSMGTAMTGSMEQKALGKVGLDAESRKAIGQKMKARLSSMNKGPGEKSLKGDRNDGPQAGNLGGSETKTPPPLPSRETQEYKDKKEKMDAEKKNDGTKTPPPLPSRKTQEYKDKKEKMDTEKKNDGNKTPPPLPSKKTQGYKEGNERIAAQKLKMAESNRQSAPRTSLPNTQTNTTNDTSTGVNNQVQQRNEQGTKSNTPSQKNTPSTGETMPKKSSEGVKEERRTDDILKTSEQSKPQAPQTPSKGAEGSKSGKSEGEKQFDTKNAGIGNKKLSPEQQKAFGEKMKKSTPGVKNRSTDDILKKKEAPQNKGSDEKK